MEGLRNCIATFKGESVSCPPPADFMNLLEAFFVVVVEVFEPVVNLKSQQGEFVSQPSANSGHNLSLVS